MYNTQLNKTQARVDDFQLLKEYQENDDLDYYLSEQHWNFHVNSILYKNLLVFYEGQELGAFLDIAKSNTNIYPIRDYTPLYGSIFNQVYRLCRDILNTPVPETKVAQFADQAATRKFRHIKDKDGKSLKLVPNVIDLIESYHILGMINTILTLANNTSPAVDRFLTSLSVYKDEGLCFSFYIHSFEAYNITYQVFICATIKDGTYLRPTYNYDEKNKHLYKTLPWYKPISDDMDEKNGNQNINTIDIPEWLSDYPQVQKLYNDAIQKYEQGIYLRNVVDDMRLALEMFLKEILENKKSLENQLPEVSKYQKEKGISQEFINMFKLLLDYYSKYQNDHVKHNDNVKPEEIDSVIGLTLLFMKNLKNKEEINKLKK